MCICIYIYINFVCVYEDVSALFAIVHSISNMLYHVLLCHIVFVYHFFECFMLYQPFSYIKSSKKLRARWSEPGARRRHFRHCMLFWLLRC